MISNFIANFKLIKVYNFLFPSYVEMTKW